MQLSDLIARFTDWCTINRKPRTVEFYRHQLAGIMKAVGDMPAVALHRRHLVKVKLSWHRLWSLQRLYSWAVAELGIMPASPFEGIKRPKLGKRTFIVARRDLTPLLRKCGSHFRMLLLCHSESAARPQEGRVLRWDQLTAVNPNGDHWEQVVNGWSYFNLEEFKSWERLNDQGDKRFIPVSPRLGRLLHRLWLGGHRTGIIFRNQNGEPWNKESIRSQVRRLRVRAALTVGRSLDRFVLYTIRHSSATEMVRKNLNIKVIAEVLGHKELRTTNRYLHLCKEDVMTQLQPHWRKDRKS